MATVENLPDGEASQRVYLVTYDEDQWNRYTPEQQEFCKDQWKAKASVIPGVKYVTLRLVPDELFPSGDKTKPYAAWTHKFDTPEVSWIIKATLVLKTDRKLDVIERCGLIEQYRAKMGGGIPYEFVEKGITTVKGVL